MPIKNVFLSSTSKDLAEYREAAYRAIERLDGYHCIRMEDFGARDSRVYDYCQAKVTECSLLVGIIGHLYGSCPEGNEKSYTEIEYDTAVSADISRLMFIAPEDFPLPASFREPQEKWDRQKIFRNRVSKDLIRSKFTSPDNLATEITTAIHNWERNQRPIRIPFQAPPLPEHFVPRPEDTKKLKDRLLNLSYKSSGVLVISAIHGLGGIGKTILATVLAHDSDVKDRFRDGVLWATLGQEPDILSLLSGWIQELGDYEFHPTTSKAATTHLHSLLQDKSMLLVVDDAWNISDVEPFLISGSDCQVIITTRDSLIASAVGAKPFELGVMTEEQSLKLLSNRLNRTIEKSEEDLALNLAHTVGYLPLAIELAASQVEDGISWIHLLKDLQEEVARLETLEMPGVDEIDEATRRYLSLKACFKLSLQRLPNYLMANFAWFGVFPEDVLLNSKMIATLWEIEERLAERDLRYLRGKSLLLSGPLLNESITTFRLHDLVHDLARNLLINPASPQKGGELPGLGLEIQDAHKILLNRYEKKTQNKQWHTIPDDGYIHAHLLWHMEKARQTKEIHDLLQEETSEGKNAWYETRDHLGQTSGFLEDIARAWRLAELTSETEIERNRQSSKMALEIRYSLITASVNSLASNIPPNLLAAMVKTHLLTLPQGLAYARLVPNLKLRDETLRRLYLCLPHPQEGLVVAREIMDEYSKSMALVDIAPNLLEPQKTEIMKEALALAMEINDNDQKSEALATIALKLPIISDSLEAVRKIQKDDQKAEILAHIASKLSEPQKMELIREALRAVRKISNIERKTELLAAIALKLLKPEDAPRIIEEAKSEDKKASALIVIGLNLSEPYKTEILIEAFLASKGIKDDKERIKAWIYIASNLQEPKRTEMFLEALASVRKTVNRLLKSELLIMIALNMQEPLKTDALLEALAAAKMIANVSQKPKILTGIALHLQEPLKTEILLEALLAAKKIKDKEKKRRLEALVMIAPNLPEPQKTEIIQEVLNAAMEIENISERSAVLTEIALNLQETQKTKTLFEALDSARRINSIYQRDVVLAEIAFNLPKLEDALAVAKEMSNDYNKFGILTKIALNSPRLEDALAVANEISNDYNKFEILTKIALNSPRLEDALAVIREIISNDQKANGLIKIALNLQEPQKTKTLREALVVAKKIDSDFSRSKIMAEIALNSPRLEDALAVIREIRSNDQKANGLIKIALNLQEPQKTKTLLEALVVAKKIDSDFSRSKIMAEIALNLSRPKEALKAGKQIVEGDQKEREPVSIVSNLPDYKKIIEGLVDAFEVAKKIHNEPWWIEILGRIESNLQEPQKTEILVEALAVVNEIGNEDQRSKALLKIRSYLPETFLKDALEVARGFRDSHRKAEALAGIAPNLLGPQEILDLSREIDDESWRTEVLARIQPDHLKTLLKDAFEIARKIEDKSSSAEVLAGISSSLLDPDEMLCMAMKIEDEHWRTEALSKIVSRLPKSQKIEISKEIIETISNKIEDEHWRAEVLAMIAPYLFENHLKQILELVKRFEYDHRKAKVLIMIASNQEAPHEILQIAGEIGDRHWRDEVLAMIAPNLRNPQEIMQAIKDIGDERCKADALVRVVPNLPVTFLNDVFLIAYNISYQHWKIKALAIIGPYLPEPQKSKVMKEAQKLVKRIRDEHWKAEALAWIAFSQSTPEDALGVARGIKKAYKRAEVLMIIARKFPELCKHGIMKEALEATMEMVDDERKVKILGEIAHNLEDPQKTKVLKDALVIAMKIEDRYKKAKTLAEISPNLPESEKIDALKEALKAANEIGDYHSRSEILATVAYPLAELNFKLFYPIWHDTHHNLARRMRRDLLSDLNALMPIIVILGGPEALMESAHAIEDVSRWWH